MFEILLVFKFLTWYDLMQNRLQKYECGEFNWKYRIMNIIIDYLGKQVTSLVVS